MLDGGGDQVTASRISLNGFEGGDMNSAPFMAKRWFSRAAWTLSRL